MLYLNAQFNSVYLYSPFSQIRYVSQSALQSLTFDLTSDQEQLPNNPSGETRSELLRREQRRIPLQDGQVS